MKLTLLELKRNVTYEIKNQLQGSYKTLKTEDKTDELTRKYPN